MCISVLKSAKKPDIVVIDRLGHWAMIIDITVFHDENLVKGEEDKQGTSRITRSLICEMYTRQASYMITKSLKHHLQRFALDDWIVGLIQKAVLDTAFARHELICICCRWVNSLLLFLNILFLVIFNMLGQQFQ